MYVTKSSKFSQSTTNDNWVKPGKEASLTSHFQKASNETLHNNEFVMHVFQK